MLRVKIFASSTQTNETSVLEGDIDHWLKSEQPVIRQMIQSSSAGQVVLTFLYDDSHRDVNATMYEAYDQDSDSAEVDSPDDEPDMLPEAELPY
ncbi:MAG TPA: hypothetical protein VGF38_21790 [Ktedonobacterales bacterium]|jgi:hypothetical protein